MARGDGAALEGAWAGSAAAAIAALVQPEGRGGVGRPLLVVTARVAGTEHFAADVAAMLGESPSANGGGGRPVALFPARDGLTSVPDPADPVFSARAGALNRLEEEDAAARPRVLVAPIQALMQPVPSRAARAAATRTLTVGEEADPEELMRWLADRGLERVPRIELPGEFSLHGGIFDVWPAGETDPLRVEFAFEEIDSLRTFDPASQRKIDRLDRARLTCLPAPPLRARGSRRLTATANRESWRGKSRRRRCSTACRRSMRSPCWIWRRSRTRAGIISTGSTIRGGSIQSAPSSPAARSGPA